MDDRSDFDAPEEDPFNPADDEVLITAEVEEEPVTGVATAEPSSADKQPLTAEDEGAAEEVAAEPEYEEEEVPFASLDELIAPEGPTVGDLDALRYVNLEVIVELGKSKMSVEQVTALQPGSVVPLDKVAGQSLDLVIGGHAVASGEVVVIDGDSYAIRITEIHSPAVARAGLLGE